MDLKMKKLEGGGNGGVEQSMVEWGIGLPNADKIAPLSLALIPRELASAFRILTEPCRTPLDVDSATEATLLNIRGEISQASESLEPGDGRLPGNDAGMADCDETADPDGKGSESRRVRKVGFEEMANVEDASARALKRPRLTWSPQLHKRFVDVVSRLGFKDAVPKNIMQLMNVEGLTRENVASHLQKYRLYLKRTRISSTSEGLSVPIPAPQSWSDSATGADAHTNGYFPATFPMMYPASPMMPVMYFGIGTQSNGTEHVVNTSTV